MIVTAPEAVSPARVRICEDIAVRWERFAAGGPLCPPGCLCIRGTMIEVTPREVEGDILAFLDMRFPAGDQPEVARLVAARELERSWGSASFGEWIRRLADAELEPQAFAVLTAALEGAVESLSGPDPAPASRFTCT